MSHIVTPDKGKSPTVMGTPPTTDNTQLTASTPLTDHPLERASLGGGMCSATPPFPPYQGVGEFDGGLSSVISTSLSVFESERAYQFHGGFSSITCLEILNAGLLTDEQIYRERSLLADFGLDSVITENDDIKFLKVALEMDTTKKFSRKSLDKINQNNFMLSNQIKRLSEIAEENCCMLRSLSRPKVSHDSFLGDSDRVMAEADEILIEFRTLYPDLSGSPRSPNPSLTSTTKQMIHCLSQYPMF